MSRPNQEKLTRRWNQSIARNEPLLDGLVYFNPTAPHKWVHTCLQGAKHRAHSSDQYPTTIVTSHCITSLPEAIVIAETRNRWHNATLKSPARGKRKGTPESTGSSTSALTWEAKGNPRVNRKQCVLTGWKRLFMADRKWRVPSFKGNWRWETLT